MKLRWKVTIGLVAVGILAAVTLARRSSSEQRALEQTRRDLRAQGFKIDVAEFDFSAVVGLHEAMERQGVTDIEQAAGHTIEMQFTRSADMRYVGQEHAVTVEVPLAAYEHQDRAMFKSCFDAEHLKRYGFSSPEQDAEVVSIRSSVAGLMPKPTVQACESRNGDALRESTFQDVYFDGHGYVNTPVYERGLLAQGDRIEGPALIEESATTTVLFPGDVANVDGWGNIVINVGL